MGDSVSVEGIMALPMMVGYALRQATVILDFLVVKIASAYNAILKWLDLNGLQAIILTYHLLVKFPTI